MRIAVYSDIHGNTPGLQAVHRKIDSLGSIDLEIFLGDAVYGGPGVSDVVQFLQGRNATILRGNHDEGLVDFERVLPKLPAAHQHAAQVWHDWILPQLSPEDLSFLAHAPLTHRETLPNGSEILFCHAAPNDTVVMLLGPDAPAQNGERVFPGVDSDILCTGHWHEHVFLNWGALQVVCAGGVGLSPDGFSRWLLIEADQHTIRFAPQLTPYDTDEFRRLAAESNMPSILHPGA